MAQWVKAPVAKLEPNPRGLHGMEEEQTQNFPLSSVLKFHVPYVFHTNMWTGAQNRWINAIFRTKGTWLMKFLVEEAASTFWFWIHCLKIKHSVRSNSYFSHNLGGQGWGLVMFKHINGVRWYWVCADHSNTESIHVLSDIYTYKYITVEHHIFIYIVCYI